eukprot:Skav201026  [mRNA]  locus=scaffold3386:55864:57360:+ [translate_table: standard]
MEAPVPNTLKAAAVRGRLTKPSVHRTAVGAANAACASRSLHSTLSGVVIATLTGSALRRKARHRRGACGAVGSEPPSILVLGGGIGGLNLAMRLSQMPWRTQPQVKLVDPKDRYVFLPLLIDYATGVVELDEFAPLFKDLLEEAPGVQHVQGLAREVDWRRRHVVLSEGEEKLDFDAAVIASGNLGARVEAPVLPGLSDALANGKALCFRSLADAECLRERLPSVNSVAIIGAGYVGVELAAGLAEVLDGQIALFGSRFLPGCEEANQRRSAEHLEKLGILRNGRVTSVDADGVTSDGQRYDCDLIIVTGALAPSDSEQIQLPALEDSVISGRAVIDEYLRVAPGVFCLGDASAGAPATGQIAMQQAESAAWNIYAQISGLPRIAWRRFKPSALGEFIALGSTEAAGVVEASQMANLLPPALPPAVARVAASATAAVGDMQGPTKVDIGGKAASLLRRLAYLYRLPGLRHRLRVVENWLQRSSKASGSDLSANVLPGL